MNNQLKSTLPPKELSLFKRIVKCYEQKQFKNGLKFAKQILSNSKFSEHGETLAMKGLILSCMGKRDEAYEYVKKGIKNDIRSSICWHVYGLVQKSDRKYDEAMKCYLLALKQDKENIQILRDLSLLQVQMRNYEGYLETRSTLFQLRPSQKASWLGYVVAQQMLENYDEAIKILEEYTRVQQNVTPYNYEHSELLVYHVSVLIEAGRFNEAMKYMVDNEVSIVDKLYYSELMAELYMKMDNNDKAQKIYHDLIDRNPDNESYYHKYLDSLGIMNNEDELLVLFDQLIEKYPRALMPRWIPLKLLSGDKFKLYADKYLKKCLRKGVWALFVQLKFLYTNSDKLEILEKLYISYKLNLNNHQSLDIETDGIIEPPTTEIFVNYLLAQHYSFIGQVNEALELVNNQLSHTPTLVDFYTLKGKIYYDAGNAWLASKCLDEAQSLDTADRYVNCVCTRYMVEAGRFNDAEDMAAKFTREGMRSIDNLNEMQCMWFLNTMAKSNQKLKKYADALQKCHEVNKHFSMMMDDQFDFHSYCLRKTTLRSYVDLLRTEDRLRDHEFYFEAANVAIEIYLHISDHPVGAEGDNETLNMENLSVSEAKKLKSKQRRQKKKLENESLKKQMEQERKEKIQKSKVQDKEDAEVVEEKIDGSKLIKTQNPIEEAIKFLQPLLTLSPKRIETQYLAYRVYEKKDKPLLMLKSIKMGSQIIGSCDHPQFHECLIRFILKLKTIRSDLSPMLNDVFDAVIKDLPYDIKLENVSKLNDEFCARNSQSMLHQFYGWHLKNLIKGSNASPDFKKLSDLYCLTSKWQDADEILMKLKEYYDLKETDTFYQTIKQKFFEKFPYCNSFMNNTEMELNRNEMITVASSHFTSTTHEENTQQLANGSADSS